MCLNSKKVIHIAEELPDLVTSVFRDSIIQYNTGSGVYNVITMALYVEHFRV